MSVPVGSLQVADISIPISIYHSGGSLQVTDGSNDCGMGWQLAAGGAVSRLVRGLPDEQNGPDLKGWLFNNAAIAAGVSIFNPNANDDLIICGDEAIDYNTLEGLHSNYTKDTEPDLFYINAPGLSAQFVFGTDGQPKLLTHQDIIIEFNPITSPDSLKVITNTGLVYSFGGTIGSIDYIIRRGYVPNATNEINTYCQYYKEKGATIRTRWKLVSISSAESGAIAKFNYHFSEHPVNGITAASSGSRQNYNLDSTNYIYDMHYRFYLKSISLKSYTATFSWYNDLLNRVVIAESNTGDTQQVDLSYFNVKSKNVIKSFLKEVKFNGTQCQIPQLYSFEYEHVGFSPSSVPAYINWEKNWGQDFFGYPNSVPSNKNKPRLYFTNNENDGRRLRAYTIPGVTSIEISGEIRTPDNSAVFGALKKINLPAGGYIAFEYEASTYMDNSLTPAVQYTGPGVRVKRIISQGGEIGYGKGVDDVNPYRAIIKDYEYKLAGSSNTSGLILSPVKLGYITAASSGEVRQVVSNLGDEPMVFYTRTVEKISGQGYTVYEFNVPGVFPQTAVGEWKATKSRIARKPQTPCIPENKVKNGFYLFPYPPSSNLDFKRGTISKITTYSETGALVYEKTSTYTTRTSNSTIVKGLRFEKIGDIYYYGIYEILTGRVDYVTQEIVKEASLENPANILQTTINYTYNANHMLSTVTSNLPNSTTTVRNIKYAKDFPFTSPPSSDTTAQAIMALNNNNRGATIIEEWTTLTVPGSSAVTTGASIVLYRNFGNGRVLPYHVKSLLPGSTFSPASMSGQSFIHDHSKYRLERTLKEYDHDGRVLTILDDRKNVVATHYSIDMGVPVASITNARAQQCIYEGFESVTSFGLTTTGSDFNIVSGWTGEKALRITAAATSLQSSTIAGSMIQKNGSKYRVSCWVFSPSGRTITFRAMVGTSSISHLTLTNNVNNAWNYLEGELNTSAVTNTFWLKIETNAAAGAPVIIDDLVCIPIQAHISLQTFLPFKGSTSSTDDRGNSVKTTYDYLGRPVSLLDRNRNLIERIEYSLKNSFKAKPLTSFAINTSEHFINTPLIFTPSSTNWICDPALGIQWEVDGVGYPSGQDHVLTHTFITPGLHNIKLIATSLTYGTAEFAQTICVQYKYEGPVTYTVTDASGQPAGLSLDCNSGSRFVNLQLPATPAGCWLDIKWTRNGQPYATGGVLQVIGYSPSNTNVIDEYVATITLDCSAYKECNSANIVAYNGTVSVSVTNNQNPNCQ